MFSQKRFKQEYKEGIVVVSISNLFHILDLSRTNEREENKLHKNNTRAILFAEQGVNKEKEKEKEKENSLIKKEISKDVEIDSKVKDKEDDENKDKWSMLEKEMKSKSMTIEKRDNVEKENKQNLTKDSSKHLSKVYKRNQTINKNVAKKKNKSSCCDYFFNLVLCNFLLLIFNNCYLWIFNYMFSDQKNHAYCFNLDIKEFRICSISEYCPTTGNHDFIYINDELISNKDIKKELQNINNKYLKFFVHETIIFSYLNKKFIKSERTLSKYSVTIISSKNENYLFNNSFKVGCDSYFLDIVLMITIAFISGNIIFGFLADIWGRKKILILVVFIEIVGGYILFISSFYIQNLKHVDVISEQFSQDFLINFIYDVDDNSYLIDSFKKILIL